MQHGGPARQAHARGGAQVYKHMHRPRYNHTDKRSSLHLEPSCKRISLTSV